MRIAFVMPPQTAPDATTLPFGTTARWLREQGHSVTLLVPGMVSTHGRNAWRLMTSQSGMSVLFVEDGAEKAFPLIQPCLLQAALEVYMILRKQHFDVVHFPLGLALGFYCTQARRVGGEFQSTGFSVAVNTRTLWQLEDEARWNSDGLDGLSVMWAEAYCLEYADVCVVANVASQHRLQAEKGLPGRVCLHEELSGLRQLESADPHGPVAEWFRHVTSLKPVTAMQVSVPAALPRISVCIAHYNHGRYLPQTLASIAAQDYPNIEVLVVDDGSTDTFSRDVFRQCKTCADERFHFFEQPNEGPAPARNLCAQKATGDYLLFFDADDLAMPSMLRALYEARMHAGLDVVGCHCLTFREQSPSGDPVPWELLAPLGANLASGLLHNTFGSVVCLMPRQLFFAIGAWTQTPLGGEDWELYARLCLRGHSYDILPRPLFWYRHGGSGMRATMQQSMYHPLKMVHGAYAACLPEYMQQVLQHAVSPLIYGRYLPLDTPIKRFFAHMAETCERLYARLFPAGSRLVRLVKGLWY